MNIKSITILTSVLSFSLGMFYSEYYINTIQKNYKKKDIPKKVKLTFDLSYIKDYNYFSINLKNESRNIYIIDKFYSQTISDFAKHDESAVNAQINYVPIFDFESRGLVENIFCSQNPGDYMYKLLIENTNTKPIKCNDFNKILQLNIQNKILINESALPILMFDNGDYVYNIKDLNHDLINKYLDRIKPKYNYVKPPYIRVLSTQNKLPLKKNVNLLNNSQKVKNKKYLQSSIYESYMFLLTKPSKFDINNYSLNNILLNNNVKLYTGNNFYYKFLNQIDNHFNIINVNNNFIYKEESLPLIHQQTDEISINDNVSTIKVPPLLFSPKNNKIKNNHQKPIKQEITKNMTIRTYLPPNIIKVKIPSSALEGIKNENQKQ